MTEDTYIVRSHYQCLASSGEAKFYLLLQDECENLHDWHFTLLEVFDLSQTSPAEIARIACEILLRSQNNCEKYNVNRAKMLAFCKAEF